jgi:hypothetical protein
MEPSGDFWRAIFSPKSKNQFCKNHPNNKVVAHFLSTVTCARATQEHALQQPARHTRLLPLHSSLASSPALAAQPPTRDPRRPHDNTHHQQRHPSNRGRSFDNNAYSKKQLEGEQDRRAERFREGERRNRGAGAGRGAHQGQGHRAQLRRRLQRAWWGGWGSIKSFFWQNVWDKPTTEESTQPRTHTCSRP